mmetsp:Transcript_13618/g.27702  ORF Transcript_13618/g.27702 Transcript_13618/m.27702 type:complete len:373 (+) Transcript_13618:31-1149(+)
MLLLPTSQRIALVSHILLAIAAAAATMNSATAAAPTSSAAKTAPRPTSSSVPAPAAASIHPTLSVAATAASQSAQPPTARHAILEWKGLSPSFCGPTFHLDLTRRIRPTPETIAAIFGGASSDSISVASPSCVRICIFDESGMQLQLVPAVCRDANKDDKGETEANGISEMCWPLQRGRTYGVAFLPVSTDGSYRLISSTQSATEQRRPVIPFRQIYSHLGDDAETIIRRLSLSFYQSIWDLPADDSASNFRSIFTQSISSPQEAAVNQANWLSETWGGPRQYTAKNGLGKYPKKALAKHSSIHRMNINNAKQWLQHMNGAMSKELRHCPEEVRWSISLYWVHFFAMFPFSDSERSEIRRLAFAEGPALCAD